MAVYAVIMAGGIGSRFWPQSRKENPKQFLKVLGEASLIQATIGRLQGLIPPEQCYVLTHERYVEKTQAQLPQVPAENILAEPISRNTAPCLAYAAIELQKRDPDAVMIVLPADHQILDVRQFHRVLHTAIEKAQEKGNLVTIGIEPTHPETGYGYIQYLGNNATNSIQPYPVKTFAEKPDLATAERFLASGDFLWNSGMFIWRACTLLDEMATYAPEIVHAFESVAAEETTKPQTVLSAFEACPKISIDYAVMEHAKGVFVVPGDFGWSDVGDWRAVYDLAEKNEYKNALQGMVITDDATGNFVQTEDKLVVLVGIHDLVVVNANDAILVCHKEKTQQVKNIVDYLHVNQLEQFV